MRLGLLHCLLRKRQGERCAFVPGLPLVHVVGAEEISGLSGYGVQSGLVEVGKVGGVALGGAEEAVDLFDGHTVAGLIMAAGTGPAADDGQTTENGMLDVKRSECAPAPLTEIRRRVRIVYCGFDRRSEKSVVTFIVLRQPALGLLGKD